MKGVIQNRILAYKSGDVYVVQFSSLIEDEATARLIADALTQLSIAYAPDEGRSEVPIDKWGLNSPKSVH